MLMINSGYGNRGRTGSYYKAVMADGPVGYWRMDNQVMVKDMTANGNDLVADNFSTLQIDGLIANDSNKGMLFNPILGKMDVEVTSPNIETLRIDGDLTIEMWMKDPTDLSTTDYLIIGANGTLAPANNRLYLLSFSSTGRLRFSWEYGNGNDNTETSANSPTFFPGQPHHVVIVRKAATLTPSSGTVTFYFDSIEVDPGAPRTFSNNPQKDILANNNQWFRIGAHVTKIPGNTSSENYEGFMDEVAIYNKVLDSTQVLAHYNAGIT